MASEDNRRGVNCCLYLWKGGEMGEMGEGSTVSMEVNHFEREVTPNP